MTPSSITSADASAMIEAQTTLLYELLEPDLKVWPDGLPHGYHSDDGHDDLEAAIDIASQVFPMHIDLDPENPPELVIAWLDKLLDDGYFDPDEPFPNFSCDGVSTQLATLYHRRALERGMTSTPLYDDRRQYPGLRD